MWQDYEEGIGMTIADGLQEAMTAGLRAALVRKKKPEPKQFRPNNPSTQELLYGRPIHARTETIYERQQRLDREGQRGWQG